MIKKYFDLKATADEMVHNGTNELDPVVRSICRKLWKIYLSMDPDDRRVVDYYDATEFIY